MRQRTLLSLVAGEFCKSIMLTNETFFSLAAINSVEQVAFSLSCCCGLKVPATPTRFIYNKTERG